MHIGVIIDGNRRWADLHNKARHEGHQAGYRNAIELIQACMARKVDYLSLYLLAKRNIQERAHAELEDIYSLLQQDFLPRLRHLVADVSIHLAGDLSLLPEGLRADLLALQRDSQGQGKEMSVMLAIGYGGQDEIVRGIQSLCSAGGDVSSLDEAGFARHLDSGVFPAPDLIIRTGGQQRLSGFLLYGAEYSELFFSPKLWPEFGADDLDAALAFYRGAQRNFGR